MEGMSWYPSNFMPVYAAPFVPSVPITSPQPTQSPSSQPQTTTAGAEVQGEYIYGTWYPMGAKEGDSNGETDQTSEGNSIKYGSKSII